MRFISKLFHKSKKIGNEPDQHSTPEDSNVRVRDKAVCDTDEKAALLQVILNSTDEYEMAHALSRLTGERLSAIDDQQFSILKARPVDQFLSLIEDDDVLMMIAKQAKSDKLRLLAGTRIQDVQYLTELVIHETNDSIMQTLFARIDDPDCLKKIAACADSVDLRLMAEEKLGGVGHKADTTPRNIHAGSISSRGTAVSVALGGARAAERIKAIEQIEDERILIRIMQKDPRPEVRIAAARKIRNAEVLVSAAEKEKEPDALHAIIASYLLSDHFTYDKFGENPKSMMTVGIIEKVTDQELLRQLASTEIDFNVRKAALDRIHDHEILYSFYLHNDDYDLRDQYVLVEEALEKVLRNEEKLNQFALKGVPMALHRALDQDTVTTVAFDENMNFYSRIQAIERINDSAVLYDLVDKGNTPAIRKAAINQLADGALHPYEEQKPLMDAIMHSSIYANDEEYQKVCSLIDRIFDQDILFAIAMTDRKHQFTYVKNVGIVYAIERVIRKITNGAYLERIAKEAPIMMNRIFAMERVQMMTLRETVIVNAASKEARLIYVRRETDENTLLEYAQQDPDEAVRETAAHRITDNELLCKLAMFSEDANIRRIAVDRMTNSQLIAVVAYNGHTTAIRRAAVNHPMFQDQKALFDIALNDDNYFVCLDALKKIEDENRLLNIVLSSPDDIIGYTAVKKLRQESSLKQVVKKAFHQEIRLSAIERITDDIFLKEIAVSDSDADVAALAANQIRGEASSFDVLCHSDDVDICHIALSKIQNTELLTQIYESNHPLSIREAAGLRLYGSKFYMNEETVDNSSQATQPGETDRLQEQQPVDFTLKTGSLRDESSRLCFRTRADASPAGKSNVYFTAQEEDFDHYFSLISDEILKKQNCAVWYLDPNIEYEKEDYEADLSRMQLFVIPVTSRFLNTDNRARLTDLRFAREHHKAVLPIMMEEGLEETFNSICGELHTINAVTEDLTAKSYTEKMKDFLDQILIGNDFAEKIRKAFDAYIFLSYRKKDRALAQELMKLIHKNDFCRDIAIWYDEYLVPGVNFNEAIYDALNRSQIFALVVTPNIVNEKNYIMETEYPYARKLEKPVLPFEMRKLGQSEQQYLNRQYDKIGMCIDPNDEKLMSQTLKDAFENMALSRDEKDAEHDFFIGLAYLNGIDVEVNQEIAVELITSAATNGVTAACQKLISMYRYGEGIPRDNNKALRYQRALTEIMEKAYGRESSSDDRKAYVHALVTLADFLTEDTETLSFSARNERLEEAERILKKAMYLCRTFEKAGKDSWAQDLLIEASGKLGDFYISRNNWLKAQHYFFDDLESVKERISPMSLGIAYMRLGSNALAGKSPFLAQDYLNEALHIFEKYYEQTSYVEARQGIAEAWEHLGESYLDDGQPSRAQICFEKAISFGELILAETRTEAAELRCQKYQTRLEKLLRG